MNCYEEVMEFIASGPSPNAVAEFRLSSESDRRAAALLEQEKAGKLSADEEAEPIITSNLSTSCDWRKRARV